MLLSVSILVYDSEGGEVESGTNKEEEQWNVMLHVPKNHQGSALEYLLIFKQQIYNSNNLLLKSFVSLQPIASGVHLLVVGVHGPGYILWCTLFGIQLWVSEEIPEWRGRWAWRGPCNHDVFLHKQQHFSWPQQVTSSTSLLGRQLIANGDT